jgi:hypothetical protein
VGKDAEILARNDDVYKSIMVYSEALRGGPQRLDDLTADLRWKPPTIMLPVLQDNLPLASSSMSHTAFYRQAKNVAVLHCNA